jgi:hypothetical protein
MQVSRDFLRYLIQVQYTKGVSDLKAGVAGYVKKLFFTLLMVLLIGPTQVFSDTTPMTITFEAQIATQQSGKISGKKDVRINLVGEVLRNGQYKERIMWSEYIENVEFFNGYCSIVLGTTESNPLEPAFFDIQNPTFQLEIDGMTASFPVPATPYAVQAKIAEEVALIHADRIVGSFTATVNIADDLVVDSGTLFVDGESNRVGVNTTDPEYTLDVDGVVNAEGFRINGREIETSLSWAKNGKAIYYTDGNVGVGTDSPEHLLDVVGTINAREYYINNVRLSDYLSRELAWQDGTGGDIYFNDGSALGNVGIGVSLNLEERLNVGGAVKIGSSIQGEALAGTIEYADNDFWGYVGDGVRRSLTGIQQSDTPELGQLAVWTGARSVEGADNLVWINNQLGVGTANPTAALDVVSQEGSAALHIKTPEGDTAFFIGEDGRIGVGTANPVQKLDINGVIDATEYYVDGVPLDEAFSEGSFWLKGNNDQVFYDLGNVGIGTSEPANLLELSATTGNAAMTFDIQGTDLFTLGVGPENPNAFVFSNGNDLDDPVFVFNGNRIGVGTVEPQANLHVSGNFGFLSTGEFGSGAVLPATGKGTRLLWYPNKAAFRAGHVLGDGWDDENLGEYSVAMGYDPIASGNRSVIAGGYKNRASGENAAILGGFENIANGENSFAAGYKAQAAHDGTFVWADYIPTADTFASTGPNQFLIRANGGVGIGTNETEGTALTVKRDFEGQHLVVAGNKEGDEDVVAITTDGALGIGTSDPGSAKIAVMNGNVGIGTTEPIAKLSITSETSDGFIFYSDNASVGDESIFVINSSGNVGIGLTNPRAEIDVRNGAVAAEAFMLVDPENPDSVVVLQPTNGSPWADPSDPKNNNNTYRSMGNVGIGTPSPNSLLELSNRNEVGARPEITFDLDGNDYYTMGIITSNVDETDVYFVLQQGGTLNYDVSALVVGTRSVGIGTDVMTPSASLTVSGNTYISGKLLVGTEEIEDNLQAKVDGIMDVQELYLAGKKFVQTDSPWEDGSGANIYYDAGNVGIGVDNPSVELEIAGTISTNILEHTGDFTLDGTLQTTELTLEDANTDDKGKIYVDTGKLLFQYPHDDDSNVIELSSPLTRTDNSTSGPLAYWVNDAAVGVMPVYWDDEAGELVVTSTFRVKGYLVESGGFEASSNVFMGQDVALGVHTDLSHRGNLSEIQGYTGQQIDVELLKDWGNDNTPIVVKGLDITMTHEDGMKFMNQASAVGMKVDVTDVNVDTDNGAQKAAAIFLGGNVGVGVEYPSTTLEVNGVVSANFFNLTGGLDVPRLTVNKDQLGFVAQQSGAGEPRVGIGTLTPTTELEVVGLVSASAVVIAEGLTSTTLNVGNNSFVVDADGEVGIGTSDPNGQIELHKSVASALTDDFTSQRIGIQIDAARESGFEFYLEKNLTGLDIDIESLDDNNFVGVGSQVTGVSINMRDLNMEDHSKATGLYVDVTGEDATRYAAIFLGGSVGIGTATPDAELDVSGDIKADNLFLEGNLESDFATFNVLVVNESASLNAVTVNQLSVLGDIIANQLRIEESLSVPDATFTTLNAGVATVDTLLTAKAVHVTESFTAGSGLFSTAVGVGTTEVPASGLEVVGGLITDTMGISGQLTLDSATLNVSDIFVVQQDGKVGIGTSTPEVPVHILIPGSDTPYTIEDNETWNAVRIQSQRSTDRSVTGLLLVPEDTGVSPNVGSGILAYKAPGVTEGSDLLFITDPESGDPAERMRITRQGYVGIGTQSPSSELDVAGDMMVTGSLTVDGTLSTTVVEGLDSILTLNSTGTTVFAGIVSTNAGTKIRDGLFLKVSDETPVADANYGKLYVESDSQDVIYLRPDGSTRNLSLALYGTAQKLPFYDVNGNLSDEASVQWDFDSNTLIIGDNAGLSQVEVVSTVSSTLDISEYASKKIQLNIDNRDGLASGSESVVRALDISMDSLNPSNLTDFGRLADGETAVGLDVDVSGVIANYNLGSGDQKGIKYAAVFQGGNVGIGVSAPQAGLHVGGDFDGDALRVDSRLKENAFVVSASGNVGIGNASPEALLDIASTGEASDSVLKVTSGNTVLFVVQNGGNVGIGTESPSELLDVNGTLAATQLIVSEGVESSTLNVGGGDFVVDSEGRIGIGTTVPDNQFSFYKNIADSSGGDFTSQRLNMVIDGATANPEGGINSFELTHSVTGLELQMGSLDETNTFGAATATGVSINMSGMALGSDATLVGLDVDVTGEEGTRYSALFMGGKVGIGTMNPTVALSVSGDIKAENLFLDGDLTAGDITLNALYVQDFVTVNGALTANRLYADLVSANHITIKGLLEVSTASFRTITVNNVAVFDTLRVGSDPSDYQLDVSGSVRIAGDLFVSGSMGIDEITAFDTLTVNFVESTQGLVVTTGSVSVNSFVHAGSMLRIKPEADLDESVGWGQIFIDEDGNLRYKKPNTSGSDSVNLLAEFTGTSTHIPFYDASGQISTDAPVYWDETNKIFTIGNTSEFTQVEVLTSLNNSLNGEVAAQEISLLVGDRSSVTTPGDFTALNIEFDSINADDNYEFGRLADGERAIGLKVDVGGVKANSTTAKSGSGDLKGYKYAAAFLGGNVGVGVDSPEASLHIGGDYEGNALRVDAEQLDNALIVDSTGNVGIGTATPRAMLEVAGRFESTDFAFKVTSGDAQILNVRNDGRVGINTLTPEASLDVAGTLQATDARFSGSMILSTLNVGNNAFVIDEDGDIGIGTSTPESRFTFHKVLTGADAGDEYVSQKLSLVVDGDTENPEGGVNTFELTHDITGMDVVLKSNASNTFGNASSSPIASGVSINMTDLLAHEDSTVIGLDVDVTGENGTRYAALFMGGNVGIGTENPTVALSVSGDVYAESLSLSGDLEAHDVTLNRLYVSEVITLNGTLDVQNLYADLISANKITVEGLMSVAVASFNAVTVNNESFINRLGVGGRPENADLEVFGTAYFADDVDVVGTLNVSRLYSATPLTINVLDQAHSLIVNGRVSVNNDVQTYVTAFASANYNIGDDANYGQLYTNSEGALLYKKPGSSSEINLLSAHDGTPGAIPFYGTDGNISDEAHLSWDETNNTFQIGVEDVRSQFLVVSTLNAATDGNVAAQKIEFSFEDRSGVSTPAGGETRMVTGLDIVFDSMDKTDEYNFGRLAEGETAVGIKVDVSGLQAKSSTEKYVGDSSLEGVKYSALFLGGNVGIETLEPQAALHIGSNSVGSPLRVDVDNFENALYVSPTGSVGVGTARPDAALAVQQQTAGDSAFQVINNSGTALFHVGDKVGVGTTNAQSDLHVVGMSASQSPFRVGIDSAASNLVVNNVGNVGIGTSSPASQAHVAGTFRVDSDSTTHALFVDDSGRVGIGTSTPEYDLSVAGLVNAGSGSHTGVSSASTGFSAIHNTDFLFFGFDSTYGDQARISWGDAFADHLAFEKYNWDGSDVTMHPSLYLVHNRVGIGTTSPVYTLHVSGNMNLDTPEAPNALTVTNLGYVGVGTDNPAASLDVKGELMADTITILNGDVTLSTLNLTGEMTIQRTIKGSHYTHYGEKIDVTLDADINDNLYGLDISLDANPNLILESERPYTLWGANAYGLRVDVSGLVVDDPTVELGDASYEGNKYAAAFLGGGVGIGTDRPNYPLHVVGPFRGILSQFGSSESKLRIRDYDSGRIGLNVVDAQETSVGADGLESEGLVIMADRVGIGTSDPDKRLVVNGDVRLGLKLFDVETSLTDELRYGSKLYFSGGPRLDSTINGDNGDELFIARYNREENRSDLRVNFSTDDSYDGEDRFQVGYTSSSDDSFQEVLNVLDNGHVGISNGQPNFEPQTHLHVKGASSGGADELKNHLVVIENTSESNANTLALVHSGIESGASVMPDHNFVTFINAGQELGAIEGNANSGIRYMTKGGDYAEYLEKVDMDETIRKGDIVGVINGKVSKSTKGAQQFLVKSTAPAVAGNWPGENKDGYELIAFFGQVHVHVIGKVNKGDYIIPSDKHDGTGIAVAPDKISIEDKARIVGRAWSESSEKGEKLIHVAVGFGFSMPSLKDDMARLEKLKSNVADLDEERRRIERKYDTLFEKQDAEIQKLMKSIESIQNKR